MKSKAPLALIEMLVMILVFALAAALCLNIFVLADRRSETNAARDRAVLAAQTAAETVKSCGGDMERAARLLNARWADGTLSIPTNDMFTLSVTPVKSETSLLGTALVEARLCDGDTCLIQLTVAWQEVAEHE